MNFFWEGQPCAKVNFRGWTVSVPWLRAWVYIERFDYFIFVKNNLIKRNRDF